MKPFIAILLALVAVVSSRPEPPVSNYLPPSYSTTQQDSFAPPPSSPSNTYGAPSALSNTYGAPSALSNTYGAPSALSNTYGAPSALSNTYGAPSALSNTYGAPSALSNTYGAPSALSNTYGAPSAPSNTYGAPSTPGSGSGSRSSFSSHSSGGSKTRFGASAQTSAIFTPSSTYGAPSSTYGAPVSGGYPASKYDKSQDDLSEPAKYEFSYQVQDAHSGNDFGHHEGRDGDVAWGSYEVLLPDGRKQVVDYQADQNGFNPQIRYEQIGYAAPSGAGGPY
ncbi:Pro-resilin [Zootermopsis nevadensis]|uniref:Pro-resilin n=1 Tax=Zootermopsis nevadensis TaxID=136037 RepID=A0A067R2U2_ZOONE|nr:Pro-resilin [Zootermopsis nevadensis]